MRRNQIWSFVKRTSPFKLAGASVQSTTGSRGVRISGSNAGYTKFRGSVRVLATHSIRQFPLPCVTVCHHISTGLYKLTVSAAETDVCTQQCQDAASTIRAIRSFSESTGDTQIRALMLLQYVGISPLV